MLMRTVLNETPPTVSNWLKQRRRLGQDRFDEVWGGVYHVAPSARPAHGDLGSQMSELLGPLARAVGLRVHDPVNIGTPADYRVPDKAVVHSRPMDAFLSTAAIVVEVVSPNDETLAKLDFYFSRGVQEMLIVAPLGRTVQWLRRGVDGMVRCEGSDLLGLTGAELHDLIDWPPTDS